MTSIIVASLLGIVAFILIYNALQAHKWHRKNAGKEKRIESGNYRRYIFYFNKDDGRIFVPKKSGGGYTINFANPVSILAGILLIAGFILFSILIGNG